MAQTQWKSFDLQVADLEAARWFPGATKQVTYRYRKTSDGSVEVQRQVKQSYDPDYSRLTDLIEEMTEFSTKYQDAISDISKDYYEYSDDYAVIHSFLGYEPLPTEEAAEVFSRYEQETSAKERDRALAARERALRELQRISEQFPDLTA